jgi:malonyl-CoA/methylmalonyl-CoA synthetase
VLEVARGRWEAGRLDEATRAAAAGLTAHGLTAGDRLLWASAPTVDAIVACLGALRLGAVVVPVNPDLTERELSHVAADVRPALAVADGPVAGRVSSLRHGPAVVAAAGLARGGGEAVALDAADPGDPALIVYTSGTTGAPKGACLSHANLAAGTTTLQLAWRWEPSDRLVLSLPLFHVHGLVAGLFGSLSAGATAVVLERFSPDGVLEAAGSASMFFGVPTMYHRLVGSGRVGELARLRLCVSGSAPLPAEVWNRAADDGVGVLERYGMTETLLTVSNPYEGERRPGTVGFPLPGLEVRLEVEEGPARPPTTGEAGALLVRGPTVFAGYWERPAASADSFVDGWFRTGDLASVDADGYLTLHGRRLDLIISGGFNVYPTEVEDVLLSHPSVTEATVTGTPSEEWGETVTAWVVSADGGIDLEALAAHAAARLAPYKRPRLAHVVDALPRNALGKVLRHELG